VADHFGSGTSRRRLLRSAVLGTIGAGAVIASGRLGGESGQAAASGDGEVHAFEGSLVDRGKGLLLVKLSDVAGARSVVVTPSTDFWKGGRSTIGELAIGDDVLVRVSGPQQTADHVWANLVRLRGLSSGAIAGGFRLAVRHGSRFGNEIDVFTDGAALRDFFTDRPTGRPPSLPAGSSIDVVGELTPSGIRATMLSFALPGAVPPRRIAPPSQKVVSATGLCTFFTMGPASFYNCPTGAGRCVTCSTARDDQTAYPALDSFCDCCDFNCCNCSKNCRNQVYTSCGHIITVVDWCNSRQRIFDIVDCGPCQRPDRPAGCGDCAPRVCNNACSDCGGGTPTGTIVDLTRPTFTVWYDPALQMCFTCQTQISVTC